MEKKLFIILAFFFVLVTNPVRVFAHFLATDGNIGAVLHVDPNDAPVAGSQTSFFFAFKDKQNKLKPTNCECTFEIIENGINVFSQPLFTNNNSSLTSANVFYTFPKIDVYEI